MSIKKNYDQELYCTNCDKYLKFKTKPEKSGNLIIVCDYCGHPHYRKVENGIITGERWQTDNGETLPKEWGIIKNSE